MTMWCRCCLSEDVVVAVQGLSDWYAGIASQPVVLTTIETLRHLQFRLKARKD